MTVATEVDVAIVQACLARIIAQEREAGAAAERKAIYDMLMEIAATAASSQRKRPPPGHKHTTAAGWLRLAAGDVMRRGPAALLAHEKNKAADAREGE